MSSSFHIWAEMVRGLQRRLLEEIASDERMLQLPLTGELVEQLAGLAHYCDETAHLVDSLDRPLAEAFARALEKTRKPDRQTRRRWRWGARAARPPRGN